MGNSRHYSCYSGMEVGNVKMLYCASVVVAMVAEGFSAVPYPFKSTYEVFSSSDKGDMDVKNITILHCSE